MEEEKKSEEYMVIVMRRVGSKAEVVRDGRVAKRGTWRHRVGRRERERYRERERELKRAEGMEQQGVRLFWHWLARSEWVVVPHVSYIKKRTIEKTYRNIYGENK